MYAWLLFILKCILYSIILKLFIVFVLVNLLFVSKVLNLKLFVVVSAFILLVDNDILNSFIYYESMFFRFFLYYYSCAVVLFLWFLYSKDRSLAVYIKYTCAYLISFLKIFYFFKYKFIKSACTLVHIHCISFFFIIKFFPYVTLFFVTVVFFLFILRYTSSIFLNFIYVVNLFCVLRIYNSQIVHNGLWAFSFSCVRLLAIFNDEADLLVMHDDYDELNHFIGDYEDPFLFFLFNIIFDNCHLFDDYDFIDFSFNDFEDDDILFLNFWITPPFTESFFHYSQDFVYKWNDLEKILLMLNSIFKFFY